MKKRFLTLLTVLVLLTLLAPLAGPGSRAYQGTGFISASDVCIRSGPGRDHDVYGKAGKGDVIQIVSSAVGDDGSLWYYGQVNGISGWVCGAYVSSSWAPVPTAAPTAPPAPSWGGSALSFAGIVSADSANVRSSAGIGGTVITQLHYGAAVLVHSAAMDADGALWYYCEYASGRYGYIRSDLVQAGVPVPTAGPTALPVTPVSFTGYTNASAVNVRSLPDGPKTGQLRKGVRVQVTGEVWVSPSLWYRVTWSGGTGYIRSDLISRSAPAAPTAAPTVYVFSEAPLSFAGTVTKDSCNIRLQPSYGAEVLLRVNAGEKLGVEAMCTDGSGGLWYRVRTADGRTGYILAELVAPDSGAGAWTGDAAWGGQAGTPGTAFPEGETFLPDTGDPYGQFVIPGAGDPYGQTVVPDTGDPYGQTVVPDTGDPYGQTVVPDTGDPYGQAYVPGTGYPDGQTLVPDTGDPYGQVITPAGTPFVPPADVSTPVPPEATPSPAQMPPENAFVTSGPTVPPVPETPAGPLPEADPLNFGACASSPGQTLSVFSAPSVIAWRADGGSASVTTTDNMWCAGYDGTWLLILYTDGNNNIRVGYISILSLQGPRPNVPPLDFIRAEATVLTPAKMTSDPMGQSDEILTLGEGSRVTWLCDCYLGSAWAYVECDLAGMPVRGFVPQAALSR